MWEIFLQDHILSTAGDALRQVLTTKKWLLCWFLLVTCHCAFQSTRNLAFMLLSLIVQSGCCKPPSSCGFTFITATKWQMTSSSSTADPDCAVWSNTDLCFNCTSCKAGVLQDMKQDWRKVAIVNIVMLVFLIIAYSVGCCAFHNSRKEGGFGGGYGKQGYP